MLKKDKETNPGKCFFVLEIWRKFLLLLATPAQEAFNESSEAGAGSFFAFHILGQWGEADVVESQIEKQGFTRDRGHARWQFHNIWCTGS